MQTKHQTRLLILATLAILAVAVYFAWPAITGRLARPLERRVLFYQDSMHPWIKSDQPGKCTVCGMDLTPIREGMPGFGVDGELVVLSSNSITVLNVQTEEVRRRPLARTLRVAGVLEVDDSRKTIVSAPVSCRIQNLAVPYAGVEVREGERLVTLFSPELAQKRSYLRAIGANQLSSGIEPAQAAKTPDPFASELVAPRAGVVVERSVYNGQYVTEGEKLLTIVDASVLWFRFDVYEMQLSWFQPGQTMDVTVDGVPGRTFKAVVAFIEPTLNEATRSAKVRAEIPNPLVTADGRTNRLLRFGMYANGRVHGVVPDVLAVPRSAVLSPGESACVYLDQGGGAFARRRVTLGRQGDEYWEIMRGLEPEDRVVTSGNVLIDAQAQINRGDRAETADTPEPCEAPVKSTPDEPPACCAAVTKNNPPVETPATAVAPPAAPALAANAPNSAPLRPPPGPNHFQVDKIRMAERDELFKKRMAAIAEAQGIKLQSETNTVAK